MVTYTTKPVKSQYELERDARKARNERFIVALNLGPGLKPQPKPRAPRKKRAFVPLNERRRSSRLSEVDIVNYAESSFAPAAAPPAKKVRSATRAAKKVDTRKHHRSPLGNCNCTFVLAPKCERCGITKVKLEFKDVGFDVDFKGTRGRSYFYVLASEDAVKKPWSK